MIDYERIKSTKDEDLIFFIYYIIITLSLYANHIEREYLVTKNKEKGEKYRNTLYIIFGTATLVYIYYTIEGFKELNKSPNEEAKRLNELALLASILVLISGFIYLYIIYKDKDINVEIAFN